MKLLRLGLLQILFVLTASSTSFAQQELISDPEIYEKEHFQKRCKIAQFGANFVTRLDINNDGIIDAVVNEGELVCDGLRGPDCTDDGCPYNFYLQVKEGGYFMIASAKMYGYDFIKRFGNMVFVMQMNPRYCERTDEKPCEITVRVRGTKFLTISKK